MCTASGPGVVVAGPAPPLRWHGGYGNAASPCVRGRNAGAEGSHRVAAGGTGGIGDARRSGMLTCRVMPGAHRIAYHRHHELDRHRPFAPLVRRPCVRHRPAAAYLASTPAPEPDGARARGGGVRATPELRRIGPRAAEPRHGAASR